MTLSCASKEILCCPACHNSSFLVQSRYSQSIYFVHKSALVQTLDKAEQEPRKKPPHRGGKMNRAVHSRVLRSLSLRSASLKMAQLSLIKSSAPSNAKTAILRYAKFKIACMIKMSLLLLN